METLKGHERYNVYQSRLNLNKDISESAVVASRHSQVSAHCLEHACHEDDRKLIREGNMKFLLTTKQRRNLHKSSVISLESEDPITKI